MKNNSTDTKTETIEPTVVDSIEEPAVPAKRKRGRPRKTDIEAKKKRNKVGRPPGEAAAIKEFKARLLNSPKSRRVFDAILDAALDDEHKNQSAAWKLLMDRLLPVSYFEKDKDGAGKAAVNITISGVGGEAINIGSSDPTTHPLRDTKPDDDPYEDYIDGEVK